MVQIHQGDHLICGVFTKVSTPGAVAQLARASHWQCEGREFESLLLHHLWEFSSVGIKVPVVLF